MENQFKKSFFVNDENVGEYVAKIATWIKNSVDAAHRTGVVLGMSGGIDCSVVARLCQVAEVDVLLVLMPYGQDMARSKSHADAMALIDAHQIPYQIFDIQPAVDALTIVDTALLAGASASNQALSKANIRPRVRMTYLYQLAQLGGRFVVGTGNMAERTVGYFTKWGDGAADFKYIPWRATLPFRMPSSISSPRRDFGKDRRMRRSWACAMRRSMLSSFKVPQVMLL